jgi:alpha-galactosidase
MEHDRNLLPAPARYRDPARIPLAFRYRGEELRGIPPEFSPVEERRRITSSLLEVVVRGRNAEGLEIRAECLEYLDFPVTEWVAHFTNRGDGPTGILSGIRIGDFAFAGENPVFVHGSGDTCGKDGYHVFHDRLERPMSLSPRDGTPCCGASPYLRLLFDGHGVNVAVGWPASWEATVSPTGTGACLSVAQKRTHMLLLAGETMRTPRIALMAFSGDETQGANLWRRWHLRHVLPRADGRPIGPNLCLHVLRANGGDEFTGATEENMLEGLRAYLARGMRPDIWWIDAGWYPCDGIWYRTGTWTHNPGHFPDGLGPIGKECEENGIRLLLWFEPERVSKGTALDREHPEWCLRRKGPENEAGEQLLNLADPECLEWLIGHVDGLIKRYHVHVYRQDFNFDPLPIWIDNEAEDRVGALENLHVQGYLRYWDELLTRNPGLWIDSCASGGRRNDLEAMRRAVPLHYTDVGYGEHPVKQLQHRMMFEWIPYFRAHDMNWADENGAYKDTVDRPPDRYSFHCAMAPALTDVTRYDAGEEAVALALEMHGIWRRAARIMLAGDYYPLSRCRASSDDWYAMQFDDPERGEGFVQAIRNTTAEEGTFMVRPVVDAGARYELEDMESGSTLRLDGAQLQEGLTFALPKATGRIWFYRRLA